MRIIPIRLELCVLGVAVASMVGTYYRGLCSYRASVVGRGSEFGRRRRTEQEEPTRRGTSAKEQARSGANNYSLLVGQVFRDNSRALPILTMIVWLGTSL